MMFVYVQILPAFFTVGTSLGLKSIDALVGPHYEVLEQDGADCPMFKRYSTSIRDKRIVNPMNYFPGWFISRAQANCKERIYIPMSRKELSLQEEDLSCENISTWGAYTAKFPRSWLDKIAALRKRWQSMGATKSFRFNFQGSIIAHKEGGDAERDWILDFVREYFTDDDVLRISKHGRPPDYPGSLWGVHDHSSDMASHFDGQLQKFDFTYYDIMIHSIFTLCPPGDMPYSERFLEAILAGSIPVIKSVSTDYASRSCQYNKVGYAYFTIDEVMNVKMSGAELEQLANRNYELLLKYQTWTQGDHVPPLYATVESQPCLSDDLCHDLCKRCWNGLECMSAMTSL